MSRIGKLPVNIPAGVTISVNNGVVTVKGPKGELKQEINPNITVEIEGNVCNVTRPNDQKEMRALHGLTRTLINNNLISNNIVLGFIFFTYSIEDILKSEETTL